MKRNYRNNELKPPYNMDQIDADMVDDMIDQWITIARTETKQLLYNPYGKCYTNYITDKQEAIDWYNSK